jgi:hypothetical protein
MARDLFKMAADESVSDSVKLAAIRGALDPRILWLTAAVTFWTAGLNHLLMQRFRIDTVVRASRAYLTTAFPPSCARQTRTRCWARAIMWDEV